MIWDFLSWSAVSMIVATTLTLLLSRDWRWSLVALALQYLAVFILFLGNWPLTMSAAKLVTGWMAAATLGMTLANREDFITAQSSRVFKFFLALVVIGSVWQGAGAMTNWISVFRQGQDGATGFPLLLASLLLIGLGMLQLGVTGEPFRVTLGLLTLLSGFELLSSPLDNSALVAALLAAVTLGIALIGSHLLVLNFDAQPEAAE
ncbi:MAG: hypothetical protein R6W69_11435 [Anaerolineales bacterium]